MGKPVVDDALTLLVGIDDTDSARDALALADVLAADQDRVLVAYIHPYGSAGGLLAESEREPMLRNIADASFSAIQQTLGTRMDREMRLVSAPSAPRGLIDLASREQARLVVIGSSHRSRPGRLSRGGTAESLLSGSSAPVAIAPKAFADHAAELKRIGCAFDGSPESRLAAGWGADLARRNTARLQLIAVYQPIAGGATSVGGAFSHQSTNTVLRGALAQELEQAAEEFQLGENLATEVVTGDAATVLIDASEDFDLLVVGSRGYGPIRTVLLGSVSRALTQDAACPVVVVPRGSDPPDGVNGDDA